MFGTLSHTYPLPAGLKTLSNAHHERERQREAGQGESEGRERKRTVKMAGKTDRRVHFATLAPRWFLPGEWAGMFQRVSERAATEDCASHAILRPVSKKPQDSTPHREHLPHAWHANCSVITDLEALWSEKLLQNDFFARSS